MAEKSLLDHFKARISGESSREEYWSIFKKFTNELASFALLAKENSSRIEICDGEIYVTIKCAKTYPSEVCMILEANDVRSVPFSVLADGYYEPFQSDLLIELGLNSTKFIDIGANMGFYSLALAKANANLNVESFEPQPQIFNLLNRNIELNQLKNQILTHNLGIGKIEETLTMYIPRFTGSGGGSMQNLHEDEGEPETVSVPVKILDSYLTSKPDLMKIDVEGFELNVISGAIEILQENKPTIMVELLRKWMKPFGHTPQDFLQLLQGIGYETFAIGQGKLIKTNMINEDTEETNFIFVHPSQKKHTNLLSKYVAK